MVFALALLVFVLTFDQNNLTKSLYRPIVSATLIGALLGNISAGAIVGSTFELFLIAFEEAGGSAFATDGYFLGAVAAAIIACTEGMDASAAISTGAIIGFIACVIHEAITWLAVLFLPSARTAAAQRNGKKLGIYNLIPLTLEALIFAAIAVLIEQNGSAMISTITESYQSNWGWILAGLAFAAKLSPAIGISVLARNLKANDYAGALLAGGAMMAVLLSVNIHTALFLSVIAAFAIAAYDFHIHIQKTTVVETPQIKEKSSLKRILQEKEEKKEPVKVVTKVSEEKEKNNAAEIKEEVQESKDRLETSLNDLTKEEIEETKGPIEKDAPVEKEIETNQTDTEKKEDVEKEDTPREKSEEEIKKERAEKQKRMEEETQVKGDDEVWW